MLSRMHGPLVALALVAPVSGCGDGESEPDATHADAAHADATQADATDSQIDAAVQHGEVILDSMAGPFSIALSGDRLFFSDAIDVDIKSCVAANCAATVTTFLAGELVATNSLKIDSGELVWATPDHIASCPMSGCESATVLYSNPAALQVTALTARAGHIYFAEKNTRTIARLELAAPVLEVLATEADDVRGLYATADKIYFTTYGAMTAPVVLSGVYVCPLTGCTGAPTALHGTSEGLGAVGVVATGSEIYWAEASKVKSCPLAGCVGAPNILFAASASYERTLVAEGSLFWSSFPSGVHRCDPADCAATHIRLETTTIPQSIDRDTTHLWWVASSSTGNGSIGRAPLAAW